MLIRINTKANFPIPGDKDAIFIDLSTNLSWIWDGDDYVAFSSSSGGGFTYMAEVPTGTQDGATAEYTLAHTPTSDDKIIFNYNGLMLTVAGGDFTRTGAVCTFATVRPTDVAHGGTDVFLANYS